MIMFSRRRLMGIPPIKINAPYSSAPPVRIRLAAGYIGLCGLVEFLASLYYVFGGLPHSGATLGWSDRVYTFLYHAVFGAAWLRSAWLLWNRKRAGFFWGLGVLLVEVVLRILTTGSLEPYEGVTGMIVILALITSWYALAT
jgi:hypothetical protein